jgi:ribosomal-protein-alanine N-acetyltransferase
MVAVLKENHVENIGPFTFRKMDEPSAHKIIRWRYDPPYDMYNCDPNNAEETIKSFLDPQYQYHSLWDKAGELVGYCCFGEDARVPGGIYGAQALDIGGGLRPDLTGQGLGSGFMEATIEFARRHFAPVAFRATVAAFNERALRVCEKAGYRRVQSFESLHAGKPFVILMREAE